MGINKTSTLTGVFAAAVAAISIHAATPAYADEAPVPNNESHFTCDIPDLSHLAIEDRIDNLMEANVFIRAGSGLGSGFIIDAEQGYIITNNHVIEQAANNGTSININLYDADEYDNLGERHSVTIIGRDSVLDIAVLQIDDLENIGDLACVNLGDSDTVRVGQTVDAIGNPLGLAFSFSEGVVSNTNRTRRGPSEINNIYSFIQHDGAINSGNSGGGLYNQAGEVIGVNFAIITPDAERSNAGLGLAVKSNDAREVANEIIEHGEARRADLEVGLFRVTASNAEQPNVEENVGARLGRLQENGIADLAGLERGDILLSVNGEDIRSPSHARRFIATLEPEDVVTAQIVRDGILQTITIDFSAEPAPVPEGQEVQETAEVEAPEEFEPWDPRGSRCQPIQEEGLAEFLLEGFGEVFVENGTRADGVLRLYADIPDDGIGEDNGSYTIVGHPYINRTNPSEGFNSNVTCLLGGGEGYPDSVLSTPWYQQQFAQAAAPETQEESPAPIVPESAPVEEFSAPEGPE